MIHEGGTAGLLYGLFTKRQTLKPFFFTVFLTPSSETAGTRADWPMILDYFGSGVSANESGPWMVEPCGRSGET